jgi:hypothetical protein
LLLENIYVTIDLEKYGGFGRLHVSINENRKLA